MIFSKITGAKKYLVLPAGVRWGNILYYLLFAENNNTKLITRDQHHLYWLQVFPAFKKMFITSQQIHPLDFEIKTNSYLQYLNDDFTEKQLINFCNLYFTQHPKIQEYKRITYPEALYINIRRGDYYNSIHEPIYGFDIVGFLNHCFLKQHLLYQKKIIIVSDDSQWCKENVHFLKNFTQEFEILEKINPDEAFFILSTAKNLLISNSTFCYWGAYISSLIYGEASKIFAPAFVHRKQNHLKQYLPHWNVIPGFNFL